MQGHVDSAHVDRFGWGEPVHMVPPNTPNISTGGDDEIVGNRVDAGALKVASDHSGQADPAAFDIVRVGGR